MVFARTDLLVFGIALSVYALGRCTACTWTAVDSAASQCVRDCAPPGTTCEADAFGWGTNTQTHTDRFDTHYINCDSVVFSPTRLCTANTLTHTHTSLSTLSSHLLCVVFRSLRQGSAMCTRIECPRAIRPPNREKTIMFLLT